MLQLDDYDHVLELPLVHYVQDWEVHTILYEYVSV